MIQITPHMRILVAVEPIDFRAGIDGLAGICRERLEADAFSGGLFVFRNRARTAVKILVYDGQGFWLCHKRLSSGRFAFWPDGTAPTQGLQVCELQVLLIHVDDLASAVGQAFADDPREFALGRRAEQQLAKARQRCPRFLQSLHDEDKSGKHLAEQLVLRRRERWLGQCQQFVELCSRGLDGVGRLRHAICDSRWRKSLTSA